MLYTVISTILVTFAYVYVCYCFVWPYLFPATIAAGVFLYFLITSYPIH